eukprot:67863-Lingulodinium_polyedra.AAC.1
MARRWEASQLEFMRQELRRRAIERLTARVEQLCARPASPVTRAAQWNTYCVSMVLYPAHVDLPAPRAARAMDTLYARAFRTADWA